MDRYKFIEELKVKLAGLPYDEIKEAIDYYEHYFDDAGAQNERRAVCELGSPSYVAAQITADFAVKDTKSESAKSKFSLALKVGLGIFALPIALPLALSLAMVVFSVLAAAAALIFSVWITGAAVAVGGIFAGFAGVSVIFKDFAVSLICSGGGLIMFGAGVLLIKASAKIFKAFFGFFSRAISRFILRRSKR